MPSLIQHQSQTSVKLLLIGDSGTGKTGSLFSLILAGYTLVILDFDNGLDILVNAIKDYCKKNPGADFEKLAGRVKFQTCTDKFKSIGGTMMVDGTPTAFSTAMNLLTNWKTADEDLGSPSSWGPDKILVLDSLTFMSDAAFRYVETVGGFKDPRQTYGEAQKKVENCLGLLYSPGIKCNVIVTSHIAYIEVQGISKGYPSSIGKALSPQIPRYFNTMLQVKSIGAGVTAKRVIASVPSGVVDLKTPLLPGNIPAELPIETGLADYFKVLRGEPPKVA